jgi:hypothetical protein
LVAEIKMTSAQHKWCQKKWLLPYTTGGRERNTRIFPGYRYVTTSWI